MSGAFRTTNPADRCGPLLNCVALRICPRATRANVSERAIFTTQFKKDLPGSDFLHWGEGELSISARRVSFNGELAPGPDYRLYLTPQLALNEQEFLAMKDRSAYIGDINTFNNFILSIPENINPAGFTGVVVWCETFGEFITAASYQ